MVRCSFEKCQNGLKQGFLLKLFPKDPKRRAEWMLRTFGSLLETTKPFFLCELHFEPDMWEKTRVDGKRKLKLKAVPTLFGDQKLSRESLIKDVSLQSGDSKNSLISDSTYSDVLADIKKEPEDVPDEVSVAQGQFTIKEENCIDIDPEYNHCDAEEKTSESSFNLAWDEDMLEVGQPSSSSLHSVKGIEVKLELKECEDKFQENSLEVGRKTKKRHRRKGYRWSRNKNSPSLVKLCSQFKCRWCPAKFNTKLGFNKHLQSKSHEYFLCSECQLTVKSLFSIRKHLKKEHQVGCPIFGFHYATKSYQRKGRNIEYLFNDKLMFFPRDSDVTDLETPAESDGSIFDDKIQSINKKYNFRTNRRKNVRLEYITEAGCRKSNEKKDNEVLVLKEQISETCEDSVKELLASKRQVSEICEDYKKINNSCSENNKLQSNNCKKQTPFLQSINIPRKVNLDCEFIKIFCETLTLNENELVDATNTSPEFKCGLCTFLTKNMKDLKIHTEEVHFKVVPYECKDCGFLKYYPSVFIDAVKSSHSCNSGVKDIDAVKTTQGQIKSDNNSLPTCLNSNPSSYEIVPTPKKFWCGLCNFAPEKNLSLQLHVKRFHAYLVLFKCKVCGFSGYYPFVILNCIKTLHQCVIDGPNLPLKDSSDKFFSSVNNSNNENIVSSRKMNTEITANLNCQYCCYSAKTSKCLELHIQRKHTKLKPFVCFKCGFHKLYSAPVLNLVKVRHKCKCRNNKFFKCSLCSYDARSKQSFLEHLSSVHSFPKPPSNTKNDCLPKPSSNTKNDCLPKPTSRSNNYLKCEICSYIGDTLDSVNVHMYKVHSNLVSWTCEKCKFSGVCQSLFASNVKTVHSCLRDYGMEKKNIRLATEVVLSTQDDMERVESLIAGSQSKENENMNVTLYKCGSCKFSSTDLSRLEFHMVRAHPHPGQVSVPCPWCRFSCSIFSLRKHVKLHFALISSSTESNRTKSGELPAEAEEVKSTLISSFILCPHCELMRNRSSRTAYYRAVGHRITRSLKFISCSYCSTFLCRCKVFLETHIKCEHEYKAEKNSEMVSGLSSPEDETDTASEGEEALNPFTSNTCDGNEPMQEEENLMIGNFDSTPCVPVVKQASGFLEPLSIDTVVDPVTDPVVDPLELPPKALTSETDDGIKSGISFTLNDAVKWRMLVLIHAKKKGAINKKNLCLLGVSRDGSTFYVTTSDIQAILPTSVLENFQIRNRLSETRYASRIVPIPSSILMSDIVSEYNCFSNNVIYKKYSHVLTKEETMIEPECPFCGIRFPWKKFVKHIDSTHLLYHIFFCCPFCKFRGKSNKSVNTHIILTHSSKFDEYCVSCEHSYSPSTHNHRPSFENSSIEVSHFSCPSCSFSSLYQGTFLQHVHETHLVRL